MMLSAFSDPGRRPIGKRPRQIHTRKHFLIEKPINFFTVGLWSIGAPAGLVARPHEN